MKDQILKIAWICHFSNSEIQSYLPLWRQVNEFGTWIPNYIKGFENNKEIELAIIAPHEYLKRYTSFSLRNVRYHFIPFGLPFWHRHWPQVFRWDILTDNLSFRKKVETLVSEFQPDIINLMGAENAYYSSSIMNLIKRYPVLVTIQGFIGQLRGQIKSSREFNYRVKVEENILKECRYFSGEQDSSTYINGFNPHHRFFKLYFPVDMMLAEKIPEVQAKFDCVYFGRMSRIKGTEEFIKVIAALKRSRSDISACIIGSGDAKPFQDIARQFDVLDNIKFYPFVDSKEELYKIVKSSKVFLVPPLQERLSMTIREAMMLKVPIIAYATGGIPYINEHSENIILVDQGDVETMAARTLYLLNDRSERSDLAEKAYQYCIQEFGLEVNCQRLQMAYKEIMTEMNK